MWSAGILMYAMLMNEFPFSHPSMNGLFEQIKTSPVRHTFAPQPWPPIIVALALPPFIDHLL